MRTAIISRSRGTRFSLAAPHLYEISMNCHPEAAEACARAGLQTKGLCILWTVSEQLSLAELQRNYLARCRRGRPLPAHLTAARRTTAELRRCLRIQSSPRMDADLIHL